MTELEMIQRAKIYMEKLAMGINPLDDSPVPEEELINNVRISRCFTFTAQMLGRMIEKQKAHSEKKAALAVDFDKRKEFEFSDIPIPVSHIMNRLNALITGENMIRFNVSDITALLIELDLLHSVPDNNGKYSRYPTSRGMDIGISVETRHGLYGIYNSVLYNRNAQQFILDNLDAIIDIRNARAENRKLPWTQSDDESLKNLFTSGYPLVDISARLRRSTPAIRNRLAELGLSTPAEDAENE